MSFIEKPFFDFRFAGGVVAAIIFVIWVNFLMTAWTNAVNLTDGLDGLASGSSMIAFAGYAIIAFWESYHIKGGTHEGFSHAVSDPLDLTIIACCAVVACFSSCGTTRTRRRSSWATPVRWRSAACSPRCPSPHTPNSSPSSSAACT